LYVDIIVFWIQLYIISMCWGRRSRNKGHKHNFLSVVVYKSIDITKYPNSNCATRSTCQHLLPMACVLRECSSRPDTGLYLFRVHMFSGCVVLLDVDVRTLSFTL